jgi:hypothetical protein
MPASLFLSALLLLLCSGCRTSAPLPPADFSAPGWRVQSGQAVWDPPGKRPELAGDLLLATNTDGDCYIQFSKMPFTLVTARITGDRWEIEFGADGQPWHGTGTPPDRFSWFHLPRALLGTNLPGNWRFAQSTGDLWRLENSVAGEKLEGVFSP